jgi:hypothetical protein
MLGTNDYTEKDDPFVTMHFDVATTGRAFCDLTLSPWKVSAGILPFSMARRTMVQVSNIWDTTSERNVEGEFPFDQETSCGPQIIQLSAGRHYGTSER